MENFTPISSFIGGMLIGLAAVGMLWLNGRITGISGILSQAIFQAKERVWRLSFLAGLLTAGLVGRCVFSSKIPIVIQTSVAGLVLAGLLVGFGTRLGSGCTSGHGICGLARLSKRSIVATIVFMVFGMLTVFCVRHL